MTALDQTPAAAAPGAPQATTEWLQAALSQGPLDSRQVQALATSAGITPKRLRRAREQLGVVISRTGSREAMRSMWTLAELSAEATAPRALANPKVQRAEDRQPPSAEPRDAAPAADPASTRMLARIEQFRAKGLHLDEARRAAQALAARDESGARAGSCAECQQLQAKAGRVPTCWPAARGFITGPRDVAQIWACDYMRRDTL